MNCLTAFFSNRNFSDISNLSSISDEFFESLLGGDDNLFQRNKGILSKMGLKNTKIQRKMEDQVAVQNNYENYSTPNECSKILDQLYHLIWIN